MLATARASVNEVAGLRVGRVEIAAMPSQSVEPLARMIKAVTEKHPGLSISVRAAFTAEDVIEEVRSGRTELGLLGSSEPLADALGAIWTAALMLDHLGHPEAAAEVERAIADVLAKTPIRTPDLGGTASTEAFTRAVLEAS
ncbi:isocitrate/isopropylmalate family dehydrogenase [Lentzea sp. BCCO 10_0856]|uniref:Isocitrate/isopropylmalate family dehydrogenase n=1 Tax=Lentzea miocenica TaxID=3095431 RepID=A0ABU4SXJ4_9PSEU|nr:isocitrate/isopropylmalate family dehydrogenase [Lentzea sp. BCCO 10_0856]MDX8030565.1 isocitrate/isopropylmalate family dehydrogenase [Lentzea sp. BCCO 10_0856]